MPRKISLKALSTLLFSALFLLSFNTASAYEPTDEKAAKDTAKTEHGEAKFDAGKLILEHIGDSYGWHLWGEGHSATTIPLPVILYTDKGVDMFMSSAFHHGEEKVEGKYI